MVDDFKNYARVLEWKLNAIAYNIPWKIQQIISDLNQMNTLMEHLITYDSISYLKYYNLIAVL